MNLFFLSWLTNKNSLFAKLYKHTPNEQILKIKWMTEVFSEFDRVSIMKYSNQWENNTLRNTNLKP